LDDLRFDFLNRHAFATVQFVQALLDSLAKLQFVNGVTDGGVGRQFFWPLPEEFLWRSWFQFALNHEQFPFNIAGLQQFSRAPINSSRYWHKRIISLTNRRDGVWKLK